MDFESFARGFRERTAARLIEFEQTMAKAQTEMEAAAKKAAKDVAKNAAENEGKGVKGASDAGVNPGRNKQTPARRSAPGRVQSVLRRD